jgi:hypothetical protein
MSAHARGAGLQRARLADIGGHEGTDFLAAFCNGVRPEPVRSRVLAPGSGEPERVVGGRHRGIVALRKSRSGRWLRHGRTMGHYGTKT